jgi:hypothetical protein
MLLGGVFRDLSFPLNRKREFFLNAFIGFVICCCSSLTPRKVDQECSERNWMGVNSKTTTTP